MAERLVPKGAFDVPDVPDFIPRKLKPWIFVIFVIIIQFSGGVYMASASDMVGDKALMREDILMAGYASLIGMSLNFAVMFRIKFRFAVRTQLLASCMVLIMANVVCAVTDSVPLMVLVCFIAGWFRMQGTFACNSTIQLWLTPYRDMSVFFCYVYIIVDGVIQLSGIASVYAAFGVEWEYMQWIMCGMLALMMIAVLVLLKPVRNPMFIPLLGIDWIGSLLWGVAMLCFAFVCIYGDYFDWWESSEIVGASLIGLSAVALNLWRATFLSHPYVSFQAMTSRNVVKSLIIYLIFFTIMSTEHVFEHSYAGHILGMDHTNLIDLNWYVFAGIVAGVGFTYFTFARRKWRYKTMTVIAFTLAIGYLSWFYFGIDYGVEKESLMLPLFMRGMSTVIISIVFLTSILQSGLPFMVFPQALTINGFGSAVMGSLFGSALIGEILKHTVAKNAAMIGANITNINTDIVGAPIEQLYGMVQSQALVESMKEIYGWLLLITIVLLIAIAVCYNRVRPFAIFPKWSTVRRAIRHVVRSVERTPVAER